MNSGHHHCHILIVDDDEDDRYIIHHSFCELQWERFIKLLDSGDSMIHYLDTLSGVATLPLLILLDYNMPKMGAEEILCHLKQHAIYRQIPVAIYSTEMNEKLSNKLMHLGAWACYQKAMNVTEARQLAEILKQQTQTTLMNHQE